MTRGIPAFYVLDIYGSIYNREWRAVAFGGGVGGRGRMDLPWQRKRAGDGLALLFPSYPETTHPVA